MQKQVKNEIRNCGDYSIIVIHSKKVSNPIEVIIDTEDIAKISIRKWNIIIQGASINVFASFGNKNVKLSRFLLDYDGPLYVDHINRNTLDNRKKNLRIVTPAENAQNRKGGIYKTPNGRWVAKLGYYGKVYHVGTFDTRKEANQARKAYKTKLEQEKEVLSQNFYDLNPERNIQPLIRQSVVKWCAKINKGPSLTAIGIYDTKEEAIAARDAAEKEKRS